MRVSDADRDVVVQELRDAVKHTGLTQQHFALMLGTSPARLSTYLSGDTIPNAALYVRALRIGEAHAAATAAGRMTPDNTANLVTRALENADASRGFRLILQARDDVAHALAAPRRPTWIYAWHQRAQAVADGRYDALLRALVAHEFGDHPPEWARGARLTRDWVPPDPFRSPAQARAQTPEWLARSRIFIAERALRTA